MDTLRSPMDTIPSQALLPHLPSSGKNLNLHTKTKNVYTSNDSIGGFLYKRREYFRKQWRRRYFVLDKRCGILNYYVEENTFGNENASLSYSLTQSSISSLLGITAKPASGIMSRTSSLCSNSKAPSEKSLDTQAWN
mmetsp:Transcript_47294/g.56873  ORF Transcript_47294/g.56873 Transcript_47294/m.56873 type:complete len:137 (-) Transcript_47294:105-515(-)